MDFIKTLKKYGVLKKQKGCMVQCEISGKPGQFLNVFFDSIKFKEYKKVEKLLLCSIPKELNDFYKEYNGISLFSTSFQIYGISQRDDFEELDTLDIMKQNMNSKLFIKCPQFSDMFIFGSYGYYCFCYKKNYDGNIYVIGTREKKIVHTFSVLDEFFNYYIEHLIAEYDANGLKLHPEKSRIGSYDENVSYEFI
ncbi:MAG: SMI1/KNR4 family protein [Bacillales bacterium]|nr:SMI1/KNR4 family protein [Bacillales bacterium]